MGESTGARRAGIMPMAAAAASGLLIAASFPLGAPLPFSGYDGWWPIAWVALVPILLVVCARRALRPRHAAGCGFATGVVGYGLILSWMIPFLRHWGHLGIPSALAVYGILVGYLAVYTACWAWGVALFRARWGVPAACLLAPAAWTGLELARSHLLGGFPWGLFGVSQHGVLATIQVADLAGVYGVSFVLVAASGLVCLGLVGFRQGSRGAPACAVVLALAIAASLAHGLKGGSSAELTAEPVDVALIQANVPQALKWDPHERERIEQEHDRMTREAAAAGAQLILWSESSIPISFTADPDYAGRVARLADVTGSEIVLGSVAYEREGDARVPYNSAFLVRPKEAIGGRYDKQRLVPFGEYVPLQWLFSSLESVVAEAGNFRAGSAPTVLHAGAGAIGPLICYEAAFPTLARASAREGATLLVNLTNDAWYAGTAMPAQHLAHAVFRAVETRRFLLRCANTGISAIVAPSGEIAARSRLDEPTIVRGVVAPASGTTPYVLLGDAFAVACAIVALLAAAACAGLPDPGASRPNRAYPAKPQPGSHEHA